MSAAVTLGGRTEVLALPARFALEHGGVLEHGVLAYERFGRRDGPLVIVQGGISAGRHVATREGTTGWWAELVRPGGAIDLRRYQVLGVDVLGGDGASSGPANHAGSFPIVGTQDQARATLALLDDLGASQVHAFVGASYGGMVGLALAALAPKRLDRLVVFGAPARSHPLATAWRSLQRDAVALGRRAGDESAGLALARALAMTTYRGADEWATRFAGPPVVRDGDARFPVQDYLDNRGADFAARFDARSFHTLSRALDLHAVDPARILAPTTILGARSDRLVPPAQLEDLAEALGGPATLRLFDSAYGHDAFLVEAARLDPWIRAALAAEGGAS